MDGINREQAREQQQEQQDPQQQQQPQQEQLPLQQQQEQPQQRQEQLVEQLNRAWGELVNVENALALHAFERHMQTIRQDPQQQQQQEQPQQEELPLQQQPEPQEQFQLRFQPFVPSRHAQQQWDEELQQLPELQRRQQRLQQQREWNSDDWITEGTKWFLLPEPDYPAGPGMDWEFMGLRTNPKSKWACCYYTKVPAEAPARTWPTEAQARASYRPRPLF